MRRVLPAVVYDTLELSALAWDGIGQPNVWNTPGDHDNGPCCIAGHAAYATSHDTAWLSPISDALLRAGIGGISDSDPAVRAVNKRLGRNPESRVTFAQWTNELGVVRGK